MQRIIQTSGGNTNGKGPKLDELWKPLLRGFRAFHRSELDGFINKRNARNLGKTILSRLFLHEARQYLLSIGASELLVRSKVNLHALIVLVLRVAPKNLKQYLKNLPAVSQSLPEVIDSFCNIFIENNKKQRQAFYSN